MTVKVRRVGNSNVVTLPRELERYGLVEGAGVSFVPMDDGHVLIVRDAEMDKHFNRIGQEVVSRRSRALEKLARHDSGED